MTELRKEKVDMKIHNHNLFRLLVISLLLGTIFITPTIAGEVNNNMISSGVNQQKALDYVSMEDNVPKSQLIVINTANLEYPLTKITLNSYKILDKLSGNISVVYLDSQGNIVDPSIFEENEQSQYVDKYGKLNPDLADYLNNMKPDDNVMVWIWLKEPSFKGTWDPAVADNSIENLGKLKNQRISDIYGQVEQPIVDSLSNSGKNITYQCKYAPVIFANLSKSDIQKLSDRSDVDMIYLSRSAKLQLQSIAQSVLANLVWTKVPQGVTGSGVQVAVIEMDGIANNQYLQQPILYYDPVNKNIGDHATEVAGIISSQHDTYRGIAYGTPRLLSANSHSEMDPDIIAATEWAISSGARILSNSWGIWPYNTPMQPNDRYFDNIVLQHGITVVAAAGNIDGYNPGGYILSPGKGYNVITVGAYDDKNTPAWYDDVMAPYSASVVPLSPHGDRIKPEVVGPSGVVGSSDVMTTCVNSPFVHNAGNGTSYSAPVVSGEAALLMQRKIWLANWPECVKAIVMASSNHNIVGNSRLSLQDGAGGVNCNLADDAAINTYVEGQQLYVPNDFPKTYYIPVNMGEKVRVAACWDDHPDLSGLPTDFDLEVYDPSGLVVGSSVSYDNNYEIYEFTAASTGTYQARLRLGVPPIRAPWEYVGFAYCKYV
jgi:hypothetical protein